MATSPNYGWLEPDNTDLVKNGALAIRTLGNAIDTTMATMTPKSIVDAKGDLIAASAADTPARLAVGNNGETLVADSSTSTGLRYTSNFAAGKNKIINGDFGIWQRGTSFTGASGFTSDRWSVAGGESGSVVSRQTFTPGTAPVAGYEGTYFLDFAKNGTTANSMFLEQKMEDVRLFAGQTITISFWMKGSTAFTNEPLFRQNFGSGGSSEVYTTTATNSVTTSWARYSVTVAVPSISGKTIGTSSFLGIWPIRYTGTSNITVSIWGVQVEAGSVATAFQTSTGTVQGELAACQRYFNQNTMESGHTGEVTLAVGSQSNTTNSNICYQFPVQMRVEPTVTMTGLQMSDQAGFSTAATLSSTSGCVQSVLIRTTMSANGAQYRPIFLIFPNAFTTAYLRLDAEL